METKDLVLLMLIPVILISLIFYTDINTITGVVTHEPKKESNIIGIYSIMPSFKTKVNYDLNDYNKIKEEFDFILSCAQNKDIESCINDINYDNEFIWKLGCDKGTEKVLYGFAEFLQDCFDSDDNNCLCRKNLELPKEKIQEYELVTTELILNEYINFKRLDIDVFNPKIDLSYSVNTNGISGWIPKRYIFGYDKFGLPSLTLVFTRLSGEKPYEIKYETFGPPIKELILYKNIKNNINLIDFVKQENNNLKYPNNQFVMDPDNKPIDINNLNNCKIKQKNIYRFCVTKKDFKIIAYDKLDGQIKERPLTIKFAAYIPPQ